MPLLVRLFMRIGARLPNHEVVVEELLPDLDEATGMVEGSFVSECVLQLSQNNSSMLVSADSQQATSKSRNPAPLRSKHRDAVRESTRL